MRWMIVFVMACASCAPKHVAQEPETPQKRTYEAVTVSPTSFETFVRLPAELAAFQAVDLRARVTGSVASIFVDRGSKVHRGMVLAHLFAPELTAERAEAEGKAAAAVRAYERLAAGAHTTSAASRDELDHAKRAAEADTAQAEALRAVESYTTLRAPFDGVVTARFVHVGALVNPAQTQPLVRIEDTSHLRLVVAVPEHVVGTVEVGTHVTFHVIAFADTVFSGTVARPAGSVDTQTRTMAVELDVDNHDGKLAPGILAQVEWPIVRFDTFLVPRNAIVQTRSRQFVVAVRDGRTQRLDVRRGLSHGDDVEVFGELDPGETIIRRASDDIQDEVEVDVKPAH